MEESVKIVVEALKPVAEKIGQGAQALFEIYTKQMVAEGVANLIAAGIALVLLIACAIVGTKLFKHGQKLSQESGARYDAGDGFKFVGAFIPSIIGFVCLVVLFAAPIEATLKLMNPQYYAIERLVKQATDKKE